MKRSTLSPNVYTNTDEIKHTPPPSSSAETTFKNRDIRTGSNGTNLVNVLLITEPATQILGCLFSRDIKNLREVCTEICSCFFQQGFFNLRITLTKLRSIDLFAYPRLYPKIQNFNPLEFTLIPIEAVVQNANDLQGILKDPRFVLKSVVFKGEFKDWEQVHKSLPETIHTIKIGKNVDFPTDFIFPKGVTFLPDCPEDHPDATGFYSQMGSVLNTQGKQEEALECYYKALAIAKKVYGEEDWAIVILCQDIAKILKSQNKIEDAAFCLRDAAILNAKLTSQKSLPNTIHTTRTGTNLTFPTGSILPEGVTILPDCPKDPKDAVAFYSKRGSLLNTQNRYEEALECYYKALAIAKKVYGEEDWTIVILYQDIANILKSQNKIKEAAFCLRDAAILNAKLTSQSSGRYT